MAIENKRILITGGAGSIGSELVRQLARHNKIFIVDINETGAFDLREELNQEGFWTHSRTGDIRDPRVVSDVFADFKPEYVFHAAALKHVTPNEEYPLEAIQTNIVGTYNVMAEAKKWKCLEKFVFISTDKVINSNSIMGATKRVAEIMVRNQGEKFVAVRFGNVLGSRGSVIPIWEKQLREGKPITITDGRMKRYFMTIEEACELVIEAAETGNGGCTMILDMGEPVSVLELAKDILKKAGSNVGIKEIGIRPGETLDEKLMTLEEERTARREGKFFVIK